MRRFHAWVGFAAAVCALGHIVAVYLSCEGIKPYSNLGWLPEQILIGVAVLVPGFAMLSSTQRLRREQLTLPLLCAVSLAVVSWAEILRYFTPMPAVFAVLAIVDSLLIASSFRRRWLAVGASALVGAWLAVTGVFLFISYSSVGA